MIFNILFFLLKIIGFLLLAILALLVLLVFASLFIPFRYRLEGKCKGDIASLNVKAQFHILFHLINVVIQYKEENLSWKCRAGWKNFTNLPENEGEIAEDIEKEIVQGLKEAAKESEETVEDVLEGLQRQAENVVEEDFTERAFEEENAAKEQETERIREEKPVKEEQETEKTEKNDFSEKEVKSKKTTVKKISALWEKIKCTLQKICAKIEVLSKQKNMVVDFLSDETHKMAAVKVWEEVKKAARRLKPDKFYVNLRYGFDDPSYTGYLLAAYSSLYPKVSDNVHLVPDFENRILQGSLFLNGHVRGITFFLFAWNIVWSRQIRRTFFDIRDFKIKR